MESYTPINLSVTNLNSSEKHYYSYTISPLRKLFNSYSKSLDYYTLHLTNERLIIEPYVNYSTLMNFYRIYSYLPLPENLLSLLNQSRITQAKKCMGLIEYKSIGLSWNNINTIEKIDLNNKLFIKISFNNLEANGEIKAFKMLEFDIFKVYPIKKIESVQDILKSLQEIFSSNDNDANFHFFSSAYFWLKNVK